MRWLAWGLLLLASAATAQSVWDFDAWMKRVDRGSQNLQRQIAARDATAASASARELEEVYERMEQYFTVRGDADDAVRWAREARESASRAQLDLAANRFKSARVNALAIAQGCHDCHYFYKPL